MTIADYEFKSEFALRNQAKGKAEGIAKGEATALLTILTARGIAVSDDVRERIMECSDLSQLDAWLKQALTVKTAEELFA